MFEEIGYRASLTALLNNTAEVFFLQGQLERASDTARARRPLRAAQRGPAPGRHRAAQHGQRDRRARRIRSRDRALRAGPARLPAARRPQPRRQRPLAPRRRPAAPGRPRRPRARAFTRGASRSLERQGNTRYVAAALSGMGEVQREAADGAGARGAHERALSLRQQLGDKFGIAESRLALAQLDARRGPRGAGRSPAARSGGGLLRGAGRRSRSGDRWPCSPTRCARSAASPEALEAARRAETLARNSERPRIRLLVNVEAARQRSADAPAEASRQLQATLAEARRIGYRGPRARSGPRPRGDRRRRRFRGPAARAPARRGAGGSRAGLRANRARGGGEATKSVDAPASKAARIRGRRS